MSHHPSTAHLHWAHETTVPCFCRSTIHLRLDKLQATPETLAALFGIVDPSTIQVQRVGHDTEPLSLQSVSGKDGEVYNYWPLEDDKHYQVAISSVTTDATNLPVVVTPIKEIFALLPGTTEEEKSARLLALSNTFYDKIWNDADAVPKDFRDKFHSLTSTERIQAFRQYDWLYEVFGGPAFAGEAPREDHLIPKVMAKHTASRMTLEHSITWLQLMERSIRQEFPDLPGLQRALGLYWLHFNAFFPYSEGERQELRRVVLAGWDGHDGQEK